MFDLLKIFLYPSFFLFLPFPLFVGMFFRPKNYEKPLKIPFFDDFKQINRKFFAFSKQSLRIKQILLWLSWFFLLIALARPQYILKINDIKSTGRDLLLVVDMSGSMAREDILDKQGNTIDRFKAVKNVVGDFLLRRVGDKVGLAVFGGTAHLYAPLTFDGETIASMLNELEIEMLDPNTAIGDGLAVAIKHLVQNDEKEVTKNKVIILLTDGKNNSGYFSPLKSAGMAVAFGIKIYAIGFIGSSNADVDEPTLIRIANGSGGQYYRATSEAQLDAIYSEIDMLEPSYTKSKAYVYIDIFYIPLIISFLLLIAGMGVYIFKK